MASLRVLAFDHEGRLVQFDTWLDDLQLYLASGAATAPLASADSSTRSQGLTRDAAARLAIRNHLQLAECAHFGQHRTAHALYDAVVARYSSPATAALGRLLLPFLFPELSAFSVVEDLFSHLRASDARYCAAVPAKDHFLSLDPTSLTVDLLEQHLLAAETSAVADVGAKRRTSKGKGGQGGGGGSGNGGGGSSGDGGGGATVGGSGGSGGGGEGSSGSGDSGGGGTGGGGTGSGGTDAQHVSSGGGQRQQQQRRSETPSPQQLREWFLRGASGGNCLYVIRTGDRAGQISGRLHTQHRCFSRLDDAWRAEFGDDVELPRWADLRKSRIVIFDLDFDAILSAMYALSVSAEGDCYRCVPPDLGIAGAALGASESGTLPGTVPAEALHTFTLDSGASRCFFRDSTTLTPLPAPVPVRLADPSGGPVLARSSLSGLHLPSFSTNLVSTTALQDALVTTTTPGGSSLYTLATEPPHIARSAQMSASGQVAASCSCRLLSHQTLLWHHRLGHPSLPRLCGMHSRLLVSGLPRSLPPLPPSPAPPCLPCVEGRQRTAPHSSSFHPTTAPLQTLHMDVWGPARVNGQSRERYFLLLVDDYTWTFLYCVCTLTEVGSRSFVRDMSADKLSPRAIPCVFLGFVPDAPRWQFYHPTSRRVFPSQDATSNEPVTSYRLFPYRSTLPPPPPLFLAPGPPPVDPLPPQGPAPSGVSQVDPLPGPAPVQVAVGSGAARGAASGGVASRGAASGGAEPGGAGSEGAETGGAEPGGDGTGGSEPMSAEPEGVEPGGAASEGAESGGVECQGDASSGGSTGASPRLSPQQLREWIVRCACLWSGAAGAGGAGGAGAGGAGVAAGARGAGGATAAGPGGAGTLSSPAVLQSVVTLRLVLSRLFALLVALLVRVLFLSPARTLWHFDLPLFHCVLLCLLLLSPLFLRSLTLSLTALSAAASALIAELLDFAAACRLDYATALVAESASASPPSVLGESALGTDVLEDRQEDFESLAAAVPRFASMLLAPEGDADAPDITTRTLTQRRLRVLTPLSGRQPWMPRWHLGSPQAPTVKRLPGSPPTFKARYVARGFSQRQGADYFQTFYPTPKMTTLRDLHEEIWLRRPPGFTESFPAGTEWSLRRPVYALRQAPCEWHDTLRTTLGALGFDPPLFLRTDTSLPPFYVHVYVDDLVFATADTETLTLVKSELQKRHTCTDVGELRSYLGLQITRDRARRTITLTQSHMVHQVLQRFGFQFSSPQLTPLSTSHLLSAPPSDESVEPSGPYPELVGCLMYLMTCTRPDLAYPLSLLARYVAPGKHRKVHWDAAKRVLRYLCSTSSMGLVLGGRGPVVLISHLDASWVDDSATQQSLQGYTFSLGSGSVSWRSTRSSLVLSSSCEAENYAGAMAAQELRWITYLLTDLGEQPCSPPVLTTLAALGFTPSTADPSLFLRTDTSLPPFYVLVYVDDHVFATADTEALTLVKSELRKIHTCTDLGELRSYLGLQITRDRARRTITMTQSHMVHQVLQRFGFQFSSPLPTPLSTGHSLSDPPSGESVEPSGPTSGMGLVIGGRGPVVLTGHADASWVEDLATQRSSEGYTFSLGSGSVSWRSTRSSSVLSSSCKAEIYAGAMAAQELR
ncbi:unnamed protein product [Closterium sp. NIES-53]